MYVVKNSLFFVIGAIVLLHTVVHHNHISTSNTLEIKAPGQYTSFTDGILKSFAFNQGDGHLEHFVNIHFAGTELLLSEILNIDFIEETNLFPRLSSEKIYPVLNLPPDPLRGPPC